ncbi:hypothetical protein ACH5RR_021585 [Cinchona calisaya]|uniref:Uncharacterized protein n=1 Tax=Cinchona calisaya TaxID=153742 RepID=A0ABD2ZJH7_9GENT
MESEGKICGKINLCNCLIRTEEVAISDLWKDLLLHLLAILGWFSRPSGRLRSYEHSHNELKPVPRVDSSDEV